MLRSEFQIASVCIFIKHIQIRVSPVKNCSGSISNRSNIIPESFVSNVHRIFLRQSLQSINCLEKSIQETKQTNTTKVCLSSEWSPWVVIMLSKNKQSRHVWICNGCSSQELAWQTGTFVQLIEDHPCLLSRNCWWGWIAPDVVNDAPG